MKKIIFTILFFLVASSAQATDITVSIPGDKLQKIIDAFSVVHNYQTEINSGEVDEGGQPIFIVNPVSKPMFARNCIRHYIRKVYEQAVLQAQSEIQKQAVADANNETELISVE